MCWKFPIRIWVLLTFLCLLFAGCSNATGEGDAPASSIDPVDDVQVELTLVQEGTTYKLYRGGIYRVNKQTSRWDFVAVGYDPDYYEKNYVERDGAVFRKGAGGALHRVGPEFSDDSEGARVINDLIGEQHGWTSFTLQSPKTPTVEDYVRLRKRILSGQAEFLDNRIEPTTEIVHAGRTALKAYAVPRSKEMVTSKASLSTELVHYVRGDDVWFTGWYYIPAESGMPLTLIDLETTWFREYPGIRVMVFDDQYLGVELKWGTKPKYCQPRGREVAIPRGAWVRVKFHIALSEKEDGVVELWQDDVKIVDARGQTLPLASIVYNSLEIGITAHSNGPLPATLYVDDISISHQLPE